MKNLFLALLVTLLFFCNSKAQSPYHYQQNQMLNVVPLNATYKVYKWVDSNNVKHLKKFHIGQKYYEWDDLKKKYLWTIYEIDEKGIWASCRKNEGDSYLDYSVLIDCKFLTH